MMDAELLRQRRAAEVAFDDPKPLYRFRVAALLAGEPLRCVPGDRVQVGDEEGRVLRVEESFEHPELVSVRFFSDERIERVDPSALKIVAPHRPGVLLGEDELAARLEEELQDAAEPRGLETLAEAARRRVKDAIPLVVPLFEQVETASGDALRRALTQVLRSRPHGEVEVAFRHLEVHPADEDLLELPVLCATATDADHAKEVLDRLEALPPEIAVRVIRRAGKGLIGAGGPAFASAAARERVASLAREHPSREVRIALFVAAAAALVQEEELLAALGSDTPSVRGAALAELTRRGRGDAALAHLAHEADAGNVARVLAEAPGPVPLAQLARLLERAGGEAPELLVPTLLRLAEHSGEEAGELLAPWIRDGRGEGLGAALWCAGLLSAPSVGAEVLARLCDGSLGPAARGLAVEALARLGHEAAAGACDAWGSEFLAQGTWGEELVDSLGLLLGQRVDAGELLGRYLVADPSGPARRARALDAAAALLDAGEVGAASFAKRLCRARPSLARFRALADALG
ncbi:MAG: hypothetical protein D6731_24755 [Planctomycetota bacterium]|nr:MAG: hypothetical protein D6731_24755 [Planctomycetota bacterium]